MTSKKRSIGSDDANYLITALVARTASDRR